MTAPAEGTSGFLLALLTESFAFRALLGSLAALLLAAGLVACGAVRSPRGRRLCTLTPALAAIVAAGASIGEAFLPQLWVPGALGSTALDVFGDPVPIAVGRGADVILIAYVAVVTVLLGRRALGVVAARRIIARATDVDAHHPLRRSVTLAAASMGVGDVRAVLVERCPGGAFTTGIWRPVVAADPALLASLDHRELEGLVAHEVAHIRRRDLLVSSIVGVLRDLTFFVPPLHLAGRWLAREQEESADAVASTHTGRPAALASGILKAFAAPAPRRMLPAAACTAVPVALNRPGLVLRRRPGRAMRAVTTRVERLIAGVPTVTALRRTVEGGLAVAVLAAGAITAIVVPSWMVSELGAGGLVFANLGNERAASSDSAAFSTFRALSAQPAVTQTSATGAIVSADPAHQAVGGCPCVESQSELSTRVRTATALPAVRWGDRPTWDLTTPAERAGRSTRPLWVVSERNGQVGVYVLGAQPDTTPAH